MTLSVHELVLKLKTDFYLNYMMGAKSLQFLLFKNEIAIKKKHFLHTMLSGCVQEKNVKNHAQKV